MTLNRRKPQEGVCRVCGCAVTQPTPSRQAKAHEMNRRTGRFWVSGHLYEEDDSNPRQSFLRLKDVVCFQHAYDDSDYERFDWVGMKVNG